MKHSLFLLFPLLLAANSPEQQRYQDCVKLVTQNTAAAFSESLAWRDQGGGVAAKHCTALALSGLGKDEPAAEMFLEAADDAAEGRGVNVFGMQMRPALIAELYGQAGNSFLLAGKPNLAIEPFSRALDFAAVKSPQAAQIAVDRARAAALMEDYAAALLDLNDASQILPDDADILLFRATARRQIGDLIAAREDIIRLVDLRPDMAAAWLERGHVARAQEDKERARQSYLRALELVEDGPVANAAQAALELMDLRTEP